MKSSKFHSFLFVIVFVFLLPVVLLAAMGSPATAAVTAASHYVKPGSSGSCVNWDNACDLQTALGAATSGSEIWVASGVYTPGNTISDTFVLTDGVAIYGGFVGTETVRAERDWEINLTVLSGDIDDNDTDSDADDVIITATHQVGDNSYHVVSSAGVTTTAVLDGFTITAGQADGSGSTLNTGGGMYSDGGSPTLNNIIFSGNFAQYGGGGIYNEDGNPILTNISFSGNASESYAGGLYNDDGSMALTDVTFSGNSAVNYGGGVYNDGGSMTLTDVTLSDNSTGSYAGGVYNDGGSMALTDVTISGNSTVDYGGGVYSDGGNMILTRVTLSGNSSGSYAGGVYNDGGSMILAGGIISGNATVDYGGGVYNAGVITITGVTISNNSSGSYGGGMYNDYGSSMTLIDVTLSGNSATDYGGGLFEYASGSTILTDVSISENSANYGGGLYIETSSGLGPMLTNVSISGNSAGTSGGGLYNAGVNNITLTNVAFSGNAARYYGGGIYNRASQATLMNVSISANYASDEDDGNGGGIFNDSSSVLTMTNSIVWNNGDASGLGTVQASLSDSSPESTISYSLVQGSGGSGSWNSAIGTDGGNNIASDPLFLTAVSPFDAPSLLGNFQFQSASPAIDVGNTLSYTSPITSDLAGNDRVINTVIDMGAYEFVSCPSDATVFVNQAATADNDGSSWANGYTTLQLALMRAQACPGINEIWVASGVYTPGNAVGDTFALPDGVAIYGGFAGTEEERAQRDWETNLTVLSGDIDGDDTDSDDDGVIITPTHQVGDNSYHVVSANGVTNTTTLDGFTITAGQADGPYPHSRGGGMYNINDSSVVLSNLIFSGNSADQGGGIYNYESSPTLSDVMFSNNSAQSSNGGGMLIATYDRASRVILTDVVFSGNSAWGDGGGLGLFNGYQGPIDLTLTDVTFSENYANNDGGGLDLFQSSATLSNVTFSDNTVRNFGGGMMSNFDSSATLSNVTFSGNQARGNNGTGGGLANDNSNATLTGVTFSGNSAHSIGGAFFNRGTGSATLTNVTFSGNSVTSAFGGGMYNEEGGATLSNVAFSGNFANRKGGGLYSRAGDPTLTNVTFSGNSADDGGGMYNNAGTAVLANAIFWNNRDGSGTGTAQASISNNVSVTPTISYSLIQGSGGSASWDASVGADGGDNIDSDPLFVTAVDPTTAPSSLGDLQLQADSPAINVGNTLSYTSTITSDLAGNDRVQGPSIDMGAYESDVVGNYIMYFPFISR